MFRSTVSKVMWVGRATVFLIGLATILALVVGIASTALGASGDNFILGQKNVASDVSTLVRRGVGPALSLQPDDGPPLKTNSRIKVTNLNADKVDGSDAPLWAGVSANGTLSRSKGVDGSVKGPTGIYNISFNRDVSQCAYAATLTDSVTGEISVTQDAVKPDEVDVTAWTSAGSAADKPFYLVVLC
jgi:hypothetical protein